MFSVIPFLESWLVAEPQQHSLITLPSLRDPPLSHGSPIGEAINADVSQVPPRNANSKESLVAWQGKDLTNLNEGHYGKSLQLKHFSVKLWQVEFSSLHASCHHYIQLPKKYCYSTSNVKQKGFFIGPAASTSEVCRKLRLGAWRQGGKVRQGLPKTVTVMTNLDKNPGRQAESAGNEWIFPWR